MRNLDECRAEIFRLGDEKIKKRKQTRRRIIAACVPLCLCFAVLSMVVLQPKLPSMKSTGTTSETTVDVGSVENESTILGTTAVEDCTIYNPTTGIYIAPDVTEESSAPIPPESTTNTTGSSVVTTGCAPLKYSGAIVEGFGSVEFYNYIDEVKKASYIGDMIEGFFNQNDVITSIDEGETDYEGGCYITLEAYSGERVIYALYPDALKNTSNGEFIFLTDLQLSKLLSEIKGCVK